MSEFECTQRFGTWLGPGGNCVDPGCDGGGGECPGDLSGDEKVNLLDFALIPDGDLDTINVVFDNWLNTCP